MATPKNLLILGGSMTGAWQKTDAAFFKGLGIAPKIVTWHAQAWRHQANAAPFTLFADQLSFNAPENKSPYFESGRVFKPLGTPFPIKIQDLSGVVFTQPTTARHFLRQLFSDGFYVHTDKNTNAAIADGGRPLTPLSRAAFFAWWRSHQFHTERFLSEMAWHHSDIPIFVTPSILPRADQKNLGKSFRRFNFRMDQLLLEILAEKYAISSCPQPIETFDSDTLTTKAEYAEPSPDDHHYSSAYVESICTAPAFKAFLATCR